MNPLNPYNPDLYKKGVIKYFAPKSTRKLFKRLAKDTGMVFKHVKNERKADIVINFEEVLTYGRFSPGTRGWHLYKNGVSRIGVLVDLPKKTRNTVLVHELGHAFGLDHYDGGVMNPPTTAGDWFNKEHLAQIKATFL